MQGKMDDVAGRVWTAMANMGSEWSSLSYISATTQESVDLCFKAMCYWIARDEVECSFNRVFLYRIKDCVCPLSDRETAQSVTEIPRHQSPATSGLGTTNATWNGCDHCGKWQTSKASVPLKKSLKKRKRTRGKSEHA